MAYKWLINSTLNKWSVSPGSSGGTKWKLSQSAGAAGCCCGGGSCGCDSACTPPRVNLTLAGISACAGCQSDNVGFGAPVFWTNDTINLNGTYCLVQVDPHFDPCTYCYAEEPSGKISIGLRCGSHTCSDPADESFTAFQICATIEPDPAGGIFVSVYVRVYRTGPRNYCLASEDSFVYCPFFAQGTVADCSSLTLSNQIDCGTEPPQPYLPNNIFKIASGGSATITTSPCC